MKSTQYAVGDIVHLHDMDGRVEIGTARIVALPEYPDGPYKVEYIRPREVFETWRLAEKVQGAESMQPTKLQRFVAWVSLLIWPTESALATLGRHPIQEKMKRRVTRG